MGQVFLTMNKEIKKKVHLDYLLYLPENYEGKSEKKWPLMLFLHGAGERGEDIEKVKKHGIPKLADAGKEFPLIVLSPQCPSHSYWPMENDALEALLEDVIENYAVDTGRLYLTGLSMGGYGTWSLAIKNPEKFAAIAPICGGGEPQAVHKIKNVPVWTFHGAKDDIVPIAETEAMVKVLEAAGGNVKFTIYPEAKHDSWTETYNNPELYDWFLQQALDK